MFCRIGNLHAYRYRCVNDRKNRKTRFLNQILKKTLKNLSDQIKAGFSFNYRPKLVKTKTLGHHTRICYRFRDIRLQFTSVSPTFKNFSLLSTDLNEAIGILKNKKKHDYSKIFDYFMRN